MEDDVCFYARATKPTRPTIRATAGFPLELAAPVKVATGAGAVVLAGAMLLYQTLVLVETITGAGVVVGTALLVQSLHVAAGETYEE